MNKKQFKKYYSDSEIRQILYEGAIGELAQLMSNHTIYKAQDSNDKK